MKDKKGRYEIFFVAGTSLIFILFLYKVLIQNSRIFDHDTTWYYGIIHYFCNSLSNASFPYWDPYDYSGQPFYYNIGITRIFEIPSLALIFLNKLFDGSFLLLYHWDFVLKIILSAVGVYLAFRQTNKYMISNFVVFLAFLFSSFSFKAMWQCGILTTFCWTPWIFWFLLRLRKEFNFYNIAGFSLFAGLSITSYQAGYVLTFLEVFILSLLINERRQILGILKNKKNMLLIFWGLLIVIALSMQAAAVFIEKDRTVPILRQITTGSQLFNDAGGGGALTPNNFIELVFPPLGIAGWYEARLLPISECTLYIGFIPLLLVFLGLIFSRDKLKLNFAVSLFITIFLAMGGKFKLKILGDYLFPFLAFARHMQLFQPFLIFGFMYFVGQGMDVLIDMSRNEAPRAKARGFME